MEIDDKGKLEYIGRCFKSVDGLWFMKVEEQFGFDKALEIDVEVWKVLPKIQARFLKPYSGEVDTLRSLAECFIIKAQMDGFGFNAPFFEGDSFTLEITECPWLKLLQKSGREHLADTIGSRICTTEYSTFAAEFACGFEMGTRICKGGETCRLRFYKEAVF